MTPSMCTVSSTPPPGGSRHLLINSLGGVVFFFLASLVLGWCGVLWVLGGLGNRGESGQPNVGHSTPHYKKAPKKSGTQGEGRH